MRQPPMGDPSDWYGYQTALSWMRQRDDGTPPQDRKEHQENFGRGGEEMSPKWTRYVAIGIAVLMAVSMLASMILPFIG